MLVANIGLSESYYYCRRGTIIQAQKLLTVMQKAINQTYSALEHCRARLPASHLSVSNYIYNLRFILVKQERLFSLIIQNSVIPAYFREQTPLTEANA